FQAEDGIRDFHVTGVQTCALPISGQDAGRSRAADQATYTEDGGGMLTLPAPAGAPAPQNPASLGQQLHARYAGFVAFLRANGFRSEERRVGKEGRSQSTERHERRT